ncbi:MAG TPA: hypothetical protein VGR73_05605 [Bryobacteraceae bacterium]|nr:hypothetical protein [Bryobacteraceae bacterium]
MSKCKPIASLGSLGLLLAGFLVSSPTMKAAKAADVPDSEQVSKLLSDTKTMAFQLKEGAATMASFTYMTVSWQSHAKAIDLVKEHVNALGRQETKLKDARAAASPWQKAAVDRITPFLNELEGYTSAIIEHLNKEPNRLTTPEYKDYLEANADYSADLATMIGDFVDYGRTKQRLERLTDKLEVPAR